MKCPCDDCQKRGHLCYGCKEYDDWMEETEWSNVYMGRGEVASMNGSVKAKVAATPSPNHFKTAKQLRTEAIQEAKLLEREFEIRLNAVRVILKLLEEPEQVTARTHP